MLNRYASETHVSPVTFYYDSSSRLRCTASGESMSHTTTGVLCSPLSSSCDSLELGKANGYFSPLPSSSSQPQYKHTKTAAPAHSTSNSPRASHETHIRRLPVLPFQNISSERRPSKQNAYNILLDKFNSSPRCKNRETGGITLCGGIDAGNKNIYISRVAEGSAGEKCNLRAGDQLLSANYISLLNQVSLKRAYDLLINSGNRFVWLTILPRAEAMQYMENRNECYTWIDCHGQSVSPPSPLSPEEEDIEIKTPETTRATPSGRLPRFKDLFSLSQLSHTPFVSKLSNFSLFRREKPQSLCHVRQITIDLYKAKEELGMTIKGGWEYGLAIYVAHVRLNSIAEKAGLRVGDQILAVNDHSFQHILQDEAEEILRSIKGFMILRVRYVGKVPAQLIEGPRPSSSGYQSQRVSMPTTEQSTHTATTPRLHPPIVLTHTMSSPCSSSSSSTSFTNHAALQQTHSYGGSLAMNLERPNSAFPYFPSYPQEERNDNDFHFDQEEKNKLKRKHSFRASQGVQSIANEGERLLETEAMKLLSYEERMTLAYYRNEYDNKSITVQAFTLFILDLLSTKEKHVIRPEDVSQFNQTLYKHKDEIRHKSKTIPNEFKVFCPGQESNDSSTFESFNPAPMMSNQVDEMPVYSVANQYTGDVTTQLVEHSIPYFEPYATKAYSGDTRFDGNESYMHQAQANHNSSNMNNSAAYRRRAFMSRRHSSGASETPSSEHMKAIYSGQRRSGDDFLKEVVNVNVNNEANNASIALIDDDRRWSIAVPECRRPSMPSNNEYNVRRSPIELTFGMHASEQARFVEGDNNQVARMQLTAQIPDVSVNERNSLLLLQHHLDHRRHSGNHLHVPDTDVAQVVHQEELNFLASSPHLNVRRHRSLPSPTFIVDQLNPSNFPHQQRSSSFRVPHHRAIAEPNGKWRIKVRKIKPFLGIAIEGENDLNMQNEPRIISIHSDGSAVKSDLRVGHIILEVDGQPMDTLNHLEAAQLIARSYYRTPHKDYIEFVVRESYRPNEFQNAAVWKVPAFQQPDSRWQQI